MTFNINDPAPSDKIRNWPSSVTTNEWPRLHDIIDADHNFQNTAGGTPDTSGWHKVVRWINQAGAWNDNTPTPINDHGQLYTKTISGTEHLLYHQGTGGNASNEAVLSLFPVRSAISFDNTATIINSSTVWNATVSKITTGKFRITFVNPSAFYIPIVSVMPNTDNGRCSAVIRGNAVYGNSVTATTLDILIYNNDTSPPLPTTDNFTACFVAILGG